MPDQTQTANDLLQDGGVGVSAAYVILTVPTEWLGVLPPLPEGVAVPLTAALGTVLGCAFRSTRVAKAARKAAKAVEAATDGGDKTEQQKQG